MEKLEVIKIFIDPKNSYSVVNETDTAFFKDDEGNGYLLKDSNHIQNLINGFMVVGGKSPVWFKKLKELGILIDSNTTSLEVEAINEDEYSYRNSIDGSFTKVSSDKVLNGKAGYYALINNVVKKLHKRSIKKYSINGVDVGNEYQYLKLLGIEKPKEQ
jgi:hypothetical protein